MSVSVLPGHESAWVAGRLASIPRQWRRRVEAGHAGRLAARNRIPEREFSIARVNAISAAAHGWLDEVAGIVGALRVPADLSDSELCDMAEAKAREAMNIAGNAWLKTPGAIRARLAQFAAGYGLPSPAIPYVTRSGKRAGVEDGPAISRLTCPIWWRRGLRKEQARGMEAAAIRIGYVHRGKGGEIYASNATVTRREQQNRRNAASLEAAQAVNMDTGEIASLAELAAASVANPAIRRGELMARIAGFEYVAESLGHVAEFVTITCPSAYHAMRAGPEGGAEDNPKWNKATPREAQSYLTRIWANCRAALWRRGIRPYGFRIAEPHHDGTPHWHLLLFLDPVLSAGRAAVGRFRAILRRYGLRQDGGERGAKANRVKFVSIRPGQGGAAGYVAKYVSKNIDGFRVQLDLEGRPAVDSSARVAAWAAAWGIRQFQQVGGPLVGVWRELRRLPEGGAYSDVVEAARAAADCGPRERARSGEAARRSAEHWGEFVRLMGGPVATRRAMPVRVAYTRPGERWSERVGMPEPAPATRYGETAAGKVYGVRDVARDRAWASDRARWEIKSKRKGGARLASPSADSRPDGEILQRAAFPVGFAFDVAPDLSAPRTCVNNCSRGDGWGDGNEEFEPVGTGAKAEIRHGGGLECAHGAHLAGAGDPDNRGTSANHRGNGGSGAPSGRDDGSRGIG